MSQTTDKADFFQSQLILTGKVMEMLLMLNMLLPRPDVLITRVRQQHSRLGYAVFEPLNLASVYAINPATGDLSQLAGALEQYRTAAINVFAGFGASRAKAVEDLFFRGKLPEVSTKARQAVAERLRVFEASCASLVRPIHAAIGYDAKERHDWLARQTAVPTGLTRHGRTNRWRTFVRHTDWTVALHLLGASTSHAGRTNQFETEVGVRTARELWSLVFMQVSSTVRATPVIGEKLPEGVSLGSIAGGLVEVKGVVEPMKFITDEAAARAVFAAMEPGIKAKDVPLPEELVRKLAPRSVLRACSFMQVGEAVADVNAWIGENSRDAEEVRRMVSHWMYLVKVHALRQKLAKHFSKDEQRLLADILAEECQEAAVAATPAK